MAKELDLDDVCAGNPLAERQLAELRADRKELRMALEDLIYLAENAMRDANRDCGEYNIDEQLAEARAALAEKGE